MILIIDNYDSFVYNLGHIFMQLGHEVLYALNDKITLDDIHNMNNIQGIVLSPGPGAPTDAGICPALVERYAETYPILGICLGHQVIAQVYGWTVDKEDPVHGATSRLFHNGRGLFSGLFEPFQVMRYHSLVAQYRPYTDLEVTGVSSSLVMSLQHRFLPIYGLQFHPESVYSIFGKHMLQNFCTYLKKNES